MRRKHLVGLIFFFTALVFVTYKFTTTYRFVTSTPVDMWTSDQTADCALVLTGGPQRVREGLDLLARQSIRKLIISGVNPTTSISEILPMLPFYGSIRMDDIVLERKSLTTYGNVQQSLPLIEALTCRDLMLVTSHLHMYRAIRTLKADLPTNINVIPRSVYTSSDPPSFFEICLETMKVLFYSIWAF